MSEERGAGNPHATFCGSRRWATASGDPVSEETQLGCAPCSYLTSFVNHLNNRRKPYYKAYPQADLMSSIACIHCCQMGEQTVHESASFPNQVKEVLILVANSQNLDSFVEVCRINSGDS